MSGFRYTTAIATTLGAVFGIAGGLRVAPSAAAWASRATLPQVFDDLGERLVDFQSQPPEGAATTGPLAKSLTEPGVLVTAISSPAVRDYDRAMELADQAVSAYQLARAAEDLASSLEFTRRERFLWRASLQKLAAIPKSSNLYEQAAAKQAQYQRLLATAESKLVEADSAFLTEIVSDLGLDPEQVHITLCQIDAPVGQSEQVLNPEASSDQTESQTEGQINGDLCRHQRGDLPMASPASLIKVPVAIALMHKVAAEDIDLDDKIYVDPGNFTEDAQGARIEVGNKYPLRTVMASMIDQSNNTATNQLIDYVGRDYLAKALNEMGYSDTYAGHKLVGDRVMPQDPGSRGNRLTSNAMTAMMVQIYRHDSPGDEELLSALVSQHDHELGYDALKDMGPAVHWIGEKTGQNRLVLGSVVAMKVGEERYALTVALDHSGEIIAMQQIIQAIAAHLLETGPLVGRQERSPSVEPIS